MCSLILSGSWKGEQAGSFRIVESELREAGSLWLAGIFRGPDGGEEQVGGMTLELWGSGSKAGRIGWQKFGLF